MHEHGSTMRLRRGEHPSDGFIVQAISMHGWKERDGAEALLTKRLSKTRLGVWRGWIEHHEPDKP